MILARPRARCFSVQATIVYKSQEDWDAYVAMQSELVTSTKMKLGQFPDLMKKTVEAGFQRKLNRGCLQNRELEKFAEQGGPAGEFFKTHRNEIQQGGRRVFNRFLNTNRGEDGGAPELAD